MFSAVLVATPVGPAHATHVTSARATQVENLGPTVTVQFDVSFTSAPTSGQIQWTTGDGGDTTMSDGVVGGVYAGDASGTGTIGNIRRTGASTTYSWVRTQPSTNVSRTRVTYSYASFGTYAMQWQACGPCVADVLDVWATGTSVADCTVDQNDPANSITYDPAITSPLIPQRVDFTLDVILVCAGSAPAAGVYALTIAGETSETCAFGQADDADVTGLKTSSAQQVSATGGRWNHHREGIHLYGYQDASRPQQSGEFYLDGSPTRYELNLWLDLPLGTVCPLSGGQFSFGHATIRT